MSVVTGNKTTGEREREREMGRGRGECGGKVYIKWQICEREGRRCSLKTMYIWEEERSEVIDSCFNSQ